MSINVSVTEYGKGLVSARARPRVRCKANVCVPVKTVAVRIRTTVAAADVLTAELYVAGMWRDHQWWGPKPAKGWVQLFDATGKQIGEGTIAP